MEKIKKDLSNPQLDYKSLFYNMNPAIYLIENDEDIDLIVKAVME